MLKAKYLNLYKKINKNNVLTTVFRYLLSGSEDMIAKYRATLEAQDVPVHTDEETGQIIYFTTVHNGDNINIEITSTGKIVVANNELEKLQSKLQLATDPALKQAMANRIADIVLGVSAPAVESASAPVASAPAIEAPVSEDDTDLDN